MNIWDPFHPGAYFLHTTLGFAGLVGAIIALSVTKGSNPHILAGRTFAVAAAAVAVTALTFSFKSFAPMAIVSAVMTLSVVGSAVLALRSRSPRVSAGELMATILMGLVLIGLLYGVVLSIPQGGLLWIPPLLMAVFCVAFLINDVRFMKQDDSGRRLKRLPRHMSRMTFAFAIAVHEPIVIFADDLRIHPGLAFYGPFILWPVLVYFFNGRLKKKQILSDSA